jgi:hypothetical protein
VLGAVHDALNANNRRYAAYYFEGQERRVPLLTLPWPRRPTRY